MIKKETINRFDKLMFTTIIKPFFEQQGFKFKKIEGTKKVGDFLMVFNCHNGDHHRGIYFNPATQTAEILLVVYLRMRSPVFQEWSIENFGNYGFEGNNTGAALYCTLPIDINQLHGDDFFTPINGDPKNGLHAQVSSHPSFIDMMNPTDESQNWHSLIQKTEALADLETMFCGDPGKPVKYASLIYRQEFERAKDAVQDTFEIKNTETFGHKGEPAGNESLREVVLVLEGLNAPSKRNYATEVCSQCETNSRARSECLTSSVKITIGRLCNTKVR